MTPAREDLRVTGARARPSRGYADPVMWVTVSAVFAAYTAISVSRYAQDNPASWDLGIFTEAVRQYAHLQAPVVAIRGAGFDLLGDHFHPALALLGPFFRVFPTPVTLLVAQAALTAISVVPVTRAGVELLGVAPGRVIGAAYGFSWGLASMNWYDFHEVALAVPLLAGSLSALARRKTTAAALWAAPLVFVKEDQGFTVAAVGLVMAFAYRRRIAGALLGVWGVAWSFAAVYLIVPALNPYHQYPYWDKGAHLSGIAAGLGAGAAVKLPTLVLILLPTAGAAVCSPLIAVAVPGLLLRFVSSDTSYWGTGWHYNATVMPVAFVAAVDGLARIRAARAARAAKPGRAARIGAAQAVGSEVGPAAVPAARALAGAEAVPVAGPEARPVAGAEAGPVAGRAAGVEAVPVAGWEAGSFIGDAAGAMPDVAADRDGGDVFGQVVRRDGARVASRAVCLLADWAAGRRGGGAARSVAGCVAGWARLVSGLLERHAPAMMAVVAVALAFQFPLQYLWSPQTYLVSHHARVADAAMRLLPAGSTVEASLNELAPLAARDVTYWVGNRNPPPQWVVFDQRSPEWSISDVPAFIRAKHAGISYRVVSANDGVWVLRRASG